MYVWAYVIHAVYIYNIIYIYILHMGVVCEITCASASCACVCVWVHACVCSFVCACACIRMCTLPRMHGCMWVGMWAGVRRVGMQVRMHVHDKYMFVCVWMGGWMDSQISRYRHIYIYIYVCVCVSSVLKS